jgi:cardiolipin synthase A/B
MDSKALRLMQNAGVEIERYHKVRLTQVRYANHRTHCRLLVTDGRIGFIGGVGIADP